MPDAHFKPDKPQWEKLFTALSIAYANPQDLRQVLTAEFPQIVGVVNFYAPSEQVAFQVLQHVDSAGADWAQFLRVVRRNKPDASQLSAIVDRILLRGALAGLHGTLTQVAGLNGAESVAFDVCLPRYSPELPWQHPPSDEGQRVAWYAACLVPAGRHLPREDIPVLRFVESIRLAVPPASAATAEQIAQWIEKTAAIVADNDVDQDQIVKFTRQHAPAAGTPWLPSMVTERYLKIDLIYEDGISMVFRARDKLDQIDVAMKVIKPEFSNDREWFRRFKREERITKQLAHPLIVPVIADQFHDGRPYLTMKLVEGQNFDWQLKARGGTPDGLATLLRIFHQACRLVAFAHTHKVIHRDLKPQNIMVGVHGEVLVMNWGSAKSMDEVDTSSTADSVFGSYPYMPPEQAAGEVTKVDRRSDVFSLGAILCEILTGDPPYKGDKLKWQAEEAQLEDANSRLDGCASSEGLALLAKRCLAKDPLDRPADAETVARHLALCLHRRDFARRWPILTMLAICLLPSVLAMSFGRGSSVSFIKDFVQNDVAKKNALDGRKITAEVVNRTFYPLALSAFVLVAWPVSRGLSRLGSDVGLMQNELVLLRRWALCLGKYAALIALAPWLQAGIVYSVSMAIMVPEADWRLAVYYLVSKTLWGLMVAAYTLFVGTAWSLHAVYPAFLLADGGTTSDSEEVYRQRRLLVRIRNLIGMVSLIGIILSVAMSFLSDKGFADPQPLYTFCAVLVIGFVMAYWLYGWINRTWDELVGELKGGGIVVRKGES